MKVTWVTQKGSLHGVSRLPLSCTGSYADQDHAKSNTKILVHTEHKRKQHFSHGRKAAYGLTMRNYWPFDPSSVLMTAWDFCVQYRHTAISNWTYFPTSFYRYPFLWCHAAMIPNAICASSSHLIFQKSTLPFMHTTSFTLTHSRSALTVVDLICGGAGEPNTDTGNPRWYW